MNLVDLYHKDFGRFNMSSTSSTSRLSPAVRLKLKSSRSVVGVRQIYFLFLLLWPVFWSAAEIPFGRSLHFDVPRELRLVEPLVIGSMFLLVLFAGSSRYRSRFEQQIIVLPILF